MHRITKFVSGNAAGLLLALSAVLAPVESPAQLPYAEEYPPIEYTTRPASDPVARLIERIEAGEVELTRRDQRGYLDSLLEALDIDPSSQLLVFSKTSQKKGLISSERPRAIYFNDSVYVAFVQGSSTLEIASMDPNLGPVFYALPQAAGQPVEFEREFARCLRCHDTYGLSGGGVPRFLLSSNLAGSDGSIVSHEISEVTDTATPIRRRWGGWYVSGTHGSQEHMGNFIVRDIQALRNVDLSRTGNITDLSRFFDPSPYPARHSDIVALLVVEHQVEVQNVMTRVNYETRTLLSREGASGVARERIGEITEPLVESLFMVHEAPLGDAVSGTSGFSDYFQTLGPFDDNGRSLRQLNLESRTFEYPLSYLIYSDAFGALPDQVRRYVFDRIHAILTGGGSESYAHLSGAQKEAILEILRDTHPAFASYIANR